MIDAQRAVFSTALTAELVDHYEQLLPRLEGFRSPVPMALACQAYGAVRFASGDTERGLRLAGTAVTSAERAGPLLEAGIFGLCAPLYLLAGHTETAASLVRRSLPLGRDQGHTNIVAESAAVAALIAATEGKLVSAATLIGAVRHHLDAIGVVGSRPVNMCLEKADAMIADSGDMSDLRSRGALMAVEEMVNHAMAVLDQHPTAAYR
jgi:hypothetical protein